MSWGLYIEVPHNVDDQWVHVVSSHTGNLTPMWRRAVSFLERPRDFDGLEAQHVSMSLMVGFADIMANMDAYKELNPVNGWGDFDGFYTVYTTLMKMCAEYPGGILRWNG